MRPKHLVFALFLAGAGLADEAPPPPVDPAIAWCEGNTVILGMPDACPYDRVIHGLCTAKVSLQRNPGDIPAALRAAAPGEFEDSCAKYIVQDVADAGKAKPPDVARVVEMLRSSDRMEAWAAVLLAAHAPLGSPEKSTIEPLLESIVRDDSARTGVRAAALSLLSEWGVAAHLDLGAIAAREPVDGLAYSAAFALVASERAKPGGNSRALALLESRLPALRVAAAFTLADDMNLMALRALRDIARDRTVGPGMRGHAISAMARFETAEATRYLVEMLDEENWFFGAWNADYQTHSLNVLIPIIQDRDVKDFGKRLLELERRIVRIPERERPGVLDTIGAARHFLDLDRAP